MKSIKSFFQKNSRVINGGFVLLLFVAGVYLFSYAPAGDDWETFYGAARRIIDGTPVYGERVTHAFYSNPPWVAGLLVPAALFPFQIAQGIVATASLVVIVVLTRRFQMNVAKMVLVLLSPPMIYTLLHGQIDALILAGVMLPSEWWPVVALSKPQVAIGLIFGVKRQRWLRAILLAAGVILLSFLLWGNWPRDLIHQPAPFVSATHNIWLGLWPFQVPVGIALMLVGLSKGDERQLIAASPFFAPYAATSSLLGPWLVSAAALETWQAVIVFISWWGAVAYRGLV